MCARTEFHFKLVEFIEWFKISKNSINTTLNPNYNLSPSQNHIIIRSYKNEREIKLMKWGLIPFWMKNNINSSKLINARIETIKDKPSFKYAFEKRRCLIAVNGWYEWKTINNIKTPFYFKTKDNSPIGLAGIYEINQNTEQKLETCCIITTDAKSELRNIHNRMPIIIHKNMYDKWLNCNIEIENNLSIIDGFNYDDISIYQVSTKMNNSKYNSEDNIKKINLF